MKLAVSATVINARDTVPDFGIVLAYFGTGLTNGRTEGFNNKAKLIKALLNACA
jgi:transposase